MTKDVSVTGVERFFDSSEIIVSKTDLKGRLTYVNRTFMAIASYDEDELLGEPHSLIRHPDMPRCIFKLLWDTIMDKQEIFAYVINRAKNGDHYWVFAHVTPSLNEAGAVIGYHSSRRVPDPKIIKDVIVPLYKGLLDEEGRHANSKEGMEASSAAVLNLLSDNGVSYDEWIFSL